MWLSPKKVKLHTAATTSGDGEIVDVHGKYGVVVVQITGITTGTVTFKGSIDGSTFVNILGNNMTSGATGATATGDGVYIVPITGLNKFKAEITVHTSIVLHATAMLLPEPTMVERP